MSNLAELDQYPYGGHSILMGSKKNPWQDVDYVLSFFGKRLSTCRKKYRYFVEKAVEQGRRPELTGGGLVRSSGGWGVLKSVEVLLPTKQRHRVKARSLLCFWTVKELGISSIAVADRLGITQPAVSRLAQRGEKLAIENTLFL